MDFTTHPHPTDGGIYLRFPTDIGVVWVRVVKEAEGVASLTVMEQNSAIEAAWMNDADAYALPSIQEQRNRFGARLMLKIMRTVKASLPQVHTWVYERKSGAHAGIRSRRGHAVSQPTH